MVEQFVQMVLDSQKHVVLLCHEKEVTSDSGSVTAITPLLTGKGVQAVGLKFDEVYRLKTTKSGNETRRTLMTKSDGISMCGSRYGVPDGTEWNYDALIKAMSHNTTQLKVL